MLIIQIVKEVYNFLNFAVDEGGHKIPWKDSAKYLVVVMDYKLSWNNYIDDITNKLSKTATGNVLSKVRHYVNKLC